jgi:hypothetical protein
MKIGLPAMKPVITLNRQFGRGVHGKALAVRNG